jgi:hypothetical protein
MDDALLVRGLERLRDLARDRDRLVLRNRPLRDAIGQRRSFDQLEDQYRLAIELLETMDRGDVGMAERRDDLRFTREAGEAIGVDQMIGKDLQRDVAPELRVAGAIDSPMPPAPSVPVSSNAPTRVPISSAIGRFGL